ncbi:hypothetical protein HA402_014659 [Bradysia odoriphaga]|nr:hypothetical protein HA402_014659 [Bradysia odoriphaga]
MLNKFGTGDGVGSLPVKLNVLFASAEPVLVINAGAAVPPKTELPLPFEFEPKLAEPLLPVKSVPPKVGLALFPPNATALPKDGVAVELPKDGGALAVANDGVAFELPKAGEALTVAKDGVALELPKDGGALAVANDGVALELPKAGEALAVAKDGVALELPKTCVVFALPNA